MRMCLSATSWFFIALGAMVFGCGNPPQDPAANQVVAPDAALPTTPPAGGQPPTPTEAGAGKADGAKVNPAVAGQFRRRLAAGRKLERQGEHEAAIGEFEKALALVPGDLRALSELSWAALQKGDNQKALIAATEAGRRAHWDKQSGSIFYNLGRAREALGDKKSALDAYVDSYRRRPNPVVLKHIEALGATVPTRLPVPECNAPSPLESLCGCLKNAGFLGEPDPPAEFAQCEVGRVLLPGLQLIHTTFGFQTISYLAARSEAGWSVIAQLDSGTSGVGGTDSEWEIKKTEIREISGRKLLWLELRTQYVDHDMGLNAVYNLDRDSVFVCLYPKDTRRPLDCIYEVAKKESSGYEAMFAGADLENIRRDDPEFPAGPPADMPKLATWTYDVQLDPAGALSVSLTSGSPNADTALAVGTKRLW